MEVTTRSRKSSLPGLVALLFFAGVAAGQDVRLPLLENIGVVPVQWEGRSLAEFGYPDLDEKVKKVFPQAVRHSRRFRVLNDDLVSALWDTPQGRAELNRDYEAHGYANLSGYVDGETVRLVCRLLGPSFQVYLEERESVSLQDLISSSDEKLYEVMANLVFRTFNRLPIDMTVVSAQGRFVTFSGGELQGVHQGMVVDIVRPSIRATHPANGTWLEFSKRRLGKARIIEVKRNTSVARLTSQAYDSAVLIGDGVKVKTISARDMFANLKDENEFKDAGGPVVVPPVYRGSKTRPDPKPEEAMPEETMAQTPEPMERKPSRASSGERKEDMEPREDEDMGPGIVDLIAEQLGEANFEAGVQPWSVSGAASASSTLPLWIFNYFRASGRGNLMPNVDYRVGGNFVFGATSDGSYFGFGAFGRGIYLLPQPAGGPVRNFRAGGEASFDSLAVTNETYGGGDLIVLGGFGGAEGHAPLLGGLDWMADVFLRPFALGQIGYEGSKRSAGSYLEYGFRTSAHMPTNPGQIEWGAGLEYSSATMSAGGSLSRSDIKLLGNARYRF